MRITRCVASQFVAILMVVALSASGWAGGTRLSTVRVASGFSYSIYAGSPPGDSQRLFVVMQDGVIKIIRLADGEVVERPFIDIRDLVLMSREGGLIGLAFHPDYADNRFFYVYYSDRAASTSIVARYRTLEHDPDRADHDSAKIILTQNKICWSHNGGMIAFGPNDGYLYIGFGDDCRSSNAQARDTWLGKMLRIDVDVDPDPYGVPPTNPFVADPDTLDEIWALGLRNPWRWSFDRDTGDMYIGDVGSTRREEINYQPAASGGGENYGWNCMEGFFCTGSPACVCNSPTLTLPIRDYDRNDGYCVIGGHVYRGQTIRDLRGTYFYADYGSGRIWSLRMVNGNVTQFEDRTAELQPDGGTLSRITSFGEDGSGELYIVTHSDGIFKIVPDGLVLGDMNGDGSLNAFDIEPFLLALFDRAEYLKQYPDIDPDVTGDINCDGVMDAFDIEGFVELLFN